MVRRTTEGADAGAARGAEAGRNDRELWERALRGDPRAQCDFVARFSRLIYKTLHAAGVPRDDIDDVYQSVQVHLWSDGGRRLRLWRGDGALGAYVATITARYAHADRQRRRREAPPAPLTLPTAQNGNALADPAAYAAWEPVDPAPGPEERLLRQEQSAAVRALLRGLPGRDADLLRRRYQDGQSYAEIADALGMTVGHVGVALFRAEARLRRRFGLEATAQAQSAQAQPGSSM